MTDLDKHVNQPGRAKLVKQVRSKIDELGIEYIFFQFISVTGRVVGKGIPTDHWERTCEKGFQLVYGATANLFTDRHGNYIGYGPEAKELVGIPDPETFCQLPWDKKVARVFVTCFRNREERDNPGAHLTSDCRGNLRIHAQEFKKKHGYQLRVGTEPEMMWLTKNEDGTPTGKGYSKPYCYHIDQFESLRPVFMQVMKYARAMGLDMIQGDHEDAPGQLELNWMYDDVLRNAKVVIIGGGIHGLSTAWKLSETYKNPGDIIVLEKDDIAAGASGIACGVVRNNYFQPAMRELMAHSVSVWESDPKAFKYNAVGYLQISPEVMHEDVATIYEQQKAIGYESEFIEGEKDCTNYMKGMFDDWQAQGITSVLHEKKGGYAFNKDSIKALENKSTSNGVQVMKGVTVNGFKRGSNSKAVTGVETDKGTIECEQVVIGAGPWARDFWNMLELPKTANIKGKDGKMHETDMWTYWMLQEGVIGVEPDFLKMNNGKQPPVIHVDSTAPLYSDKTKKLITDKIWGIYYKPDIEGLGVQGGTSPYIVDKHFDKVNVDPYGLESPEFQTTEAFNDMWCSALAHCQKRFEGKSDLYRKGPSGGLGCMTPDSFPIFDRFLENVYMIADANHGYKMIGVGELVAKEILGTESDLLKPFRFNRYEKGELHPTSNSPFPWS